MFGFPRRAATGNTMCRSSAGWRPSKSSEARTFLGLATSDSPTFAGLTSAGFLRGVYTQVTDGAVSTPDGSTSMVQTLAEGGYPSCRWVHAAAAADNRIWDAVVVGSAWSLRCVNDAYGSVLNVLGFLRTGVASCSASITASLAVTGKTGLNGGSATTGALMVATATETALSGPSVWDGRHAVLGGPANSASAAGLGIAVNQTSSDIYTFALSPGVAWRSVYHQAANHYWMLSGDTSPTLAVLSGGVTTIYGSAPGTAGAGEVRVGGGQINAAGGGTFGGQCTISTGGTDESLLIKATGSPYIGFYPSGGSTRKGYIQVLSAGPMVIANEGASPMYIYGASSAGSAQFDDSATADDTRFLLWDVTAGSLKRVTRGAADSGGTGYRLLRIAN